MILFVSGIDTGIGKTIATGLIARWYAGRRYSVVTLKLVQTGCDGFSEDILTHRRLMGIGLLPEDRAGTTCPYSLKFAGSPHLAAALEGRRLETERLAEAARTLAAGYDVLLIEGAGGLCVPLTDELTTVDFVAGQGWPVVLVATPRLGSINHTLLSLEAIRARQLALAAVIYNLHDTAAPEIVADTRRVFAAAILRLGVTAPVLDLPDIATCRIADCDFTGLPTPSPR